MSEDLNLCQQPIHWVTNDAQLFSVCEQWQHLPMLALDTEFIRTNTYYPKSALIQVNDGDANYLIDPLTINDWLPFTALLQNVNVKKVLHACSEDLEVFNHLFGCLPCNFLDTQVAAAFCGLGFSVGYAAVVESILGVNLPKGETRSNWLQRPLTESQVQYAALDVEHLFSVAELLLEKLSGLEKRKWVEQECLALLANYQASQDPELGIQRFKGAWRLNPTNYQVLTRLSHWREKVAQQRNLPRNFVVKEKALYQIAELLPSSVAQFRDVNEFSEKAAHRYGEDLLSIIREVKENTEQTNTASAPKPLSSAQKNLVKKMREQLQTIADSLAIAPEYLARKKDFEYIARAVTEGREAENILPESLMGWREPLVKKTILSLI